MREYRDEAERERERQRERERVLFWSLVLVVFVVPRILATRSVIAIDNSRRWSLDINLLGLCKSEGGFTWLYS